MEEIGEGPTTSESVTDIKETVKTDGSQKSVSVSKHKKTYTKIVGKQTPQVEEVRLFRNLTLNMLIMSTCWVFNFSLCFRN